VNIFNISKINSEVRGGRSPRIKRLSEYIGQSYFDYLAGLEDLVLIMDESHRYRASAGIRAINELNPVLGLELTATPFVETNKGAIPFKNVIYDYPLGIAIADGFVKEPAVVTRKNFNPTGMAPEEIERMKLEDGVRLHESVKVELETYARETGTYIVKPFLLVIARDTTHAGQLIRLIQSDEFFEGRYKTKVIQVDSSRTGAEEDEMVQRLLDVESTEEPTEIVIHVNMLKEGWDVTNLYTIVPLRAANPRILIEQSIGRGLRLPYGKRTGITPVDRLNIIAHDRFQEIIEEANRPDSAIHLRQVILDPAQLQEKSVTVVSLPVLDIKLGLQPGQTAGGDEPAIFQSPEEQKVVQITRQVIRELENQPHKVPSAIYLQQPEILALLKERVEKEYHPAQLELEGVLVQPDIEDIVAKTTEMVIHQTIDIPRIVVLPKSEVRSGFKPFQMDLGALRYPTPSEELWIQHLRTNQLEVLGLGKGGIEEDRLEDYIVSGLVDFDDVAYEDHADLRGFHSEAGMKIELIECFTSESIFVLKEGESYFLSHIR
jgi:type III restriction enzyme